MSLDILERVTVRWAGIAYELELVKSEMLGVPTAHLPCVPIKLERYVDRAWFAELEVEEAIAELIGKRRFTYRGASAQTALDNLSAALGELTRWLDAVTIFTVPKETP